MRSIILTASLAVTLSGPTQAASQCKYAADSYNSAVDSIGYALKRYARCVEGSAGSDDCSLEFRRLRSAQSDFESAVSSYRSECE